MAERSYRSVVKCFTWRALAFIDTGALTFLFTGNPLYALTLSGSELVTKSVLYYVHERVWVRGAVWWDRRQSNAEPLRESRTYAALKAVTWRVVGSADTFLLALLITGRLGVSASIGVAEIATKTILYYFHERVWGKIRWGVREGAKQRGLSQTLSQPAFE